MCFILHGTSIHLTKCAATELADGTVIYQAKAGSRGRASRAIFRQIRSRSKAEVEKAERAMRPPVAKQQHGRAPAAAAAATAQLAWPCWCRPACLAPSQPRSLRGCDCAAQLAWHHHNQAACVVVMVPCSSSARSCRVFGTDVGCFRSACRGGRGALRNVCVLGSSSLRRGS
ncbi:unnamed protein product [Lampetra fluviatilis]